MNDSLFPAPHEPARDHRDDSQPMRGVVLAFIASTAFEIGVVVGAFATMAWLS